MICPPNSSGCISAKVVVCFPLKCESEISPVGMSKFESRVLIKVDFPTPEWPETIVTLSFISAFIEATELTDEKKLDALENYIRKYREEGHPESQIKKWLIDYGYDTDLVTRATEVVDNAGANISS